MDPSSLARTIDRARRQDPDAQAALFDAFGGRVFGLLYRLTGNRDVAEDLLQETFLRMVRMIDKYEHDGRFEAWLFRIAANLGRDHARQRGRRGTMASLDAPDADGATPPRPDTAAVSPSAGMMQQERGQALEAAMQRLPDAEREILLLRHHSELPFREIADLLGVPLGTALARAHRALKRLRGELERLGVTDVD